MIEVYRKYSTDLAERFGEKVYKLPIKIDATCPNRDGKLGYGGCIFCGEEGGSFENCDPKEDIRTQLLKNKAYIGSRYGAKKFIAYFQNFTNTYVPFGFFKTMIEESMIDGVVGINISTRPDSVTSEQMQFLQDFSEKHDLEITLELGLQSINPQTLSKINRHHGVAEYIDCVLKAKQHNLRICTHLILNLPWDTDADAIDAAKLLGVLHTHEVKLHSLYILKDTKLGYLYEKGEIAILPMEDYKARVILFLRYLDEHIAVQRLLSRAPKENTLFCNWDTSWWKIRDEIVDEMKQKGYHQGDLCHLTRTIVF